MRKMRTAAATIAIATLLLGCGGMTDTERALLKAEAAVENAITAQAASYAPARLHTAQMEFQRAEELAEAGDNTGAIAAAVDARLAARQALAAADEGRIAAEEEEEATEASDS
ncbi:MAG: hypothetical protein AAF416_11455 [Pseudomonadota bacterium]